MARDEVEDIKRHFDVVAERIESQVQQVAKGVILNSERLDSVKEGVARLETRMDHVEVRLDAMGQRLDRHDVRFDAIDEHLDRHDVALDAMGQRLDRHDVRFDAIDEHLEHFATEVRSEFAEVKAITRLSYAEIDRRIVTLEHVVADLAHRVELLEGRSS